jgi:RHS repeat-associated protein
MLGIPCANVCHAPLNIGLDDVISLSSSSAHVLAARADGSVWSWGQWYSSYQLGYRLADDAPPIPREVPGLGDVVAVAAGQNASLALKRDGTVWTWGDATRLGDGTRSPRWTPGQVPNLTDVVAITAGVWHNIALKRDGTLWSWGSNGNGALGLGSPPTSNQPYVWTPEQIPGLPPMKDVAAQGMHSLAVDVNGDVWAWGHNVYGQLGDGTNDTRYSPVKLARFASVRSVAASDMSGFAVSDDDRVFGWGGAFVGDGTSATRLSPVALSISGVRSVTAGARHAFAVRHDDSVYAWGSNHEGQLGDGTTVTREAPTLVPSLRADLVAAGGSFSVAASDAGLFTWGQTDSGTIGMGCHNYHCPRPTPVDGMTGATAISAKWTSSAAVRFDGSLWTWGSGYYGQLGNGSTGSGVNANVPVQVAGLPRMKEVAVGYDHMVSLAEDGTVRTWGSNTAGQLGYGGTSSMSTPVTVSGLSNVVAVSAGLWHSLALRSDGTVWGWGANNKGELGTGATGNAYTAVQAAGGFTDAVAIAAGVDHSLVLRADGTVWSFGYNRDGQLGNGTKGEMSVTSPTMVVGLSAVSGISADWGKSLAYTVGGQIWTWGAGLTAPTPLPAVGGAVVDAEIGRGSWAVALTSAGEVWRVHPTQATKVPDITVPQTAIATSGVHHFSIGVSTPLTVPVESLRGRRQSQSTVADPVDTASGNFIHEERDLESPRGVYGMEWERTHNSRNGVAGPLGPGWTTSFSDAVFALPDGSARLTKADGRVVVYPSNGAGGYSRPGDEAADLTRLADGTWRLVRFAGDTWAFDAEGRLVTKTNWDGQLVVIWRLADGRISSVESSTGASLQLTYDGGALSGVAAGDGRAIAYGRSPQTGHLERATRPGNLATLYATDAAGRVISVNDPSGVNVVTNTYDTDGRVVAQTTGTVASTTTFVYVTATATTYVRDTATGQMLVYSHDPAGRVTSVRDAAHKVLSKSYDAGTGHLSGVVNRLGGTSLLTLDPHGNVTSSVNPAGVRRSATFDGRDRPTTITEPSRGTTTYTYQGESRVPTTVTDGAGKQTLYVSTDGLVTKETDPDGVVTTHVYGPGRRLASTTVAPGTSVEATTRYAYDSAGRVLTITDPEGGVTTHAYDPAGRVASVTNARGKTTTYTHDNAGRLLTTTAPGGAVTTHTYDASGRLRTTTTPRGKTTTYDYDVTGLPSAVTAPDGKSSTSTYGVMGRLASLRDETNRTTGFAYDSDGNLTRATDGLANTETVSYDNAGRETATHDPLERQASSTSYDPATGQVSAATALGGASKTFGYDAVGRLVRVTDERGGVTTLTHTAAGRTASVTTPDGVTATNGYDAAGRLSSETTMAGVTRHEYDRAGRETKTTSPGGLVTTRTFDPAGLLLTTTDPAGVTTTYTYTDRGQVKTESLEGAGTVTYAYDPDGNLKSVTDANGRTTKYDYDDRGRLSTRTDGLEKATTYGYDEAGRATSRTDALGRARTYEYDGAGRLSKSADASGRSVVRTYDAAGQVRTSTYGDGSKVDYTYDAAGRRATMTDAGGTTRYEHDGGGALTKVVTPDGRVVAYSYDNAGRRRSMTVPDGSTVTYAYDAMSRLASVTPAETMADSFNGADGADPDTVKWARTTASGGTATVQGNSLRLVAPDTSGATAGVTASVSAATNAEVSLTYAFADTIAGAILHVRLRSSGTGSYYVEVANNSSTISLYKKVGTKITLVAKFTGTVDTLRHGLRFRVQGTQLSLRVWDAAQPEPTSWNLQVSDSSVTAAGGLALAWTRSRGPHTVVVDDVRYKDVSTPPVALATYAYDGDGNVRTEGLVNGSRTWTYTDGRLTGLSESVPGLSQSTTLAYDASGRISADSTNGVTTAYGYDPSGQLLHARPAVGAPMSFTYDALGRRKTKTVGATTSTYTYDDAGQLVSATDGTTTTAYAYDGAGRRLSETTGALVVSYAYDAVGRLATYGSGTTSQARTYDGDNRLVGLRNTTAGTTTATGLTWDLARAVPQLVEMANGSPTSLFSGKNTWVGMRRGATTSALAVDVRGSVLSTPGTAAVARASGYDAFGVPSGTATFEPRLGYRGELTVDGLVHLRAREYQPGSGTFTTTDPLDGVPGTPTVSYPYHYADNDPLHKVDPLGTSPGQSPMAGMDAWMRQRDQLLQLWYGEEQAPPAPDAVSPGPPSDPWTGESPHWLRDKASRAAVAIYYGTVRARTTGMCGDVVVDAIGFSAEAQGCVLDDGNRLGVAAFHGFGIGVAIPATAGASVGGLLSNARKIEDVSGGTACVGVALSLAVSVGAEVCFSMYQLVPDLSSVLDFAAGDIFTGVFTLNVGVGLSAGPPGPSGRFVVGWTRVAELWNYPWIVDIACGGRIIDNPFELDALPLC